MAGYMVKLEGGDEKIPQGIGEKIQRHPCLFRPSNPFTRFGGIVVKLYLAIIGSLCLFVWT